MTKYKIAVINSETGEKTVLDKVFLTRKAATKYGDIWTCITGAKVEILELKEQKNE